MKIYYYGFQSCINICKMNHELFRALFHSITVFLQAHPSIIPNVSFDPKFPFVNLTVNF